MNLRWLVPLLLSSACGQANEICAQTTSQPLVGGAPAPPGEYPATGALLYAFGDAPQSLLCAATLIAPQVVVTAAHCTFGVGKTLPDFALADDVHAPDRRSVRTVNFVVEPHFVVEPEDGIAAHDLAAFVLSEPIDAVPPAPLPNAADSAAWALTSTLTLVAYGPLARASVAGTKNVLGLPVAQISESELIVAAAPPDATACVGDSGGAAYADAGGRAVFAGVISRAEDPEHPCETGTILTRVDAHEEWLDSVIAARGEAPTASSSGCSESPP